MLSINLILNRKLRSHIDAISIVWNIGGILPIRFYMNRATTSIAESALNTEPLHATYTSWNNWTDASASRVELCEWKERSMKMGWMPQNIWIFWVTEWKSSILHPSWISGWFSSILLYYLDVLGHLSNCHLLFIQFIARRIPHGKLRSTWSMKWMNAIQCSSAQFMSFRRISVIFLDFCIEVYIPGQ